MASIINASTSSGIVQTADTSGILQLQSNGTTIATISSTGLQQNVGAPAFSAASNASQAISQSTWTKITLQDELFDTNNNFASSRFTPTVAGYYQFNLSVNFGGNATALYGNVSLYKNGSLYKTMWNSTLGTLGSLNSVSGSTLANANGTTDYFELYVYVAAQANISVYGDGSDAYTSFSGFLARSA